MRTNHPNVFASQKFTDPQFYEVKVGKSTQLQQIEQSFQNLKIGDSTRQRVAFLFGYTYPKEVWGEGLRKKVKGIKQPVKLCPLTFVKSNVEKMELFLQEKGYTCRSFVDIDFTPGQLHELGMKIKQVLRIILKENPTTQLEMFFYFSGHGALCKTTQAQVLYNNKGHYLYCQYFVNNIITSGEQLFTVAMFNCCRTILTTERMDRYDDQAINDKLEKIKNGFQTSQKSLKNCNNYSYYFSCEPNCTVGATEEFLCDFLNKYDVKKSFYDNKNMFILGCFSNNILNEERLCLIPREKEELVEELEALFEEQGLLDFICSGVQKYCIEEEKREKEAEEREKQIPSSIVTKYDTTDSTNPEQIATAQLFEWDSKFIEVLIKEGPTTVEKQKKALDAALLALYKAEAKIRLLIQQQQEEREKSELRLAELTIGQAAAATTKSNNLKNSS